MQVTLELQAADGAHFVATNAAGNRVEADGSEALGGKDLGMRPMELFLASLGSCSAMDILAILRKQRQPIEGLSVRVAGQRADAVPAVYEAIEVVFTAKGQIDPDKLQQAAALSVEKYCSVISMIRDSVKVTFRTELAG